jgi:hypothetical protein
MSQPTNRYYMLMASLPRLAKNFRSGLRIPMDRETLYQRIKELKPMDYKEMKTLFDFATKLHSPMILTDEKVLKLYVETLDKLQYTFTKDLIHEGLLLRLALYVFRMRAQGKSPRIPEASLPIIRHINDNIDHPELKLKSRIQGISTIREAVQNENVLEAERQIDDYKWFLSEKLAEGEFFTFKAFIAWFIKWDILYRWSRVDKDTGIIGFENILGEVQRYEF